MDELIQQTALPNGLRVLTEQMPSVRTAAVGIYVGAGSRVETASQHGISHFLEHLFFKGTDTRTALEIAQTADDIGGQMNAFTDREQTVFYIKVLSAHLDRALEIYADMLLRSTLAAESLERERQVIVEEIKSYEDAPDELVQDLFAQTVWNGHPLGRPVIGTLATVPLLSRGDFVEFIGAYYRPDNVVIAVAGDVRHGDVVDLVNRHFGNWSGRAARGAEVPPIGAPGVATRFKETEQVHLCIGTEGLPQASDEQYTLAVLDNILGGGLSSRLFQEIREQRGLVYTITSYASSYRDGGLIVIYAGMSPDAGPEVITLTLRELDRIASDPLADAELQRAKESLKANLMLSLESTSSRMSKLARGEIYYRRQISLDEIVGRIDTVSSADVQALAGRVFRPERMAMAAVGPFRADGTLAAEMRNAFERHVELTRS